MAVASHAPLPIEHRRAPAVLDPDGEHREQHERNCGHQQPEAREDVETALQRPLQRRGAEPAAEDEPARAEHVEADLAGLALEESRQLEHVDAGEPALEELVHREISPAVVHRDDDLVHLVGHRPAEQVVGARGEPVLAGRNVVALGGDERDDLEATRVRAATQLEQARGALARAVDQHPALEQIFVHHALEQQAHRGQCQGAQDPHQAQHLAPHRDARQEVVDEGREPDRVQVSCQDAHHDAGGRGTLPGRIETDREQGNHPE